MQGTTLAEDQDKGEEASLNLNTLPLSFHALISAAYSPSRIATHSLLTRIKEYLNSPGKVTLDSHDCKHGAS